MLSNNKNTKIDINSLLKGILKQWWLILLVSIGVYAVTYVVVDYNYRPVYTTTSTFIVLGKGTNSFLNTNISTTKDLAVKFSQVLNSSVLQKRVEDDLGVSVKNAEAVAEVIPETNLITLQVTDLSPDMAFRVTRSMMSNYSELVQYLMQSVDLKVIQPPEMSYAASNHNQAKDKAKNAFFISIMVLISLLCLTIYMRDTVKSESEVSKKLDTGLLGVIYHERKSKFILTSKRKKKVSMLINNQRRSFRYVESYKLLATKIRNKIDVVNGKVILVTSFAENEGKSTVAANIALALAQEKRKVLLLDGDLRRPAQYKVFKMDETEITSLHTVLIEKKRISDALVFKADADHLHCVFNTVSQENSPELLGKPEFCNLVEHFAKSYDYIVIDSAPMGVTADAEVIGDVADASILVVRQDYVLAKDINDKIDLLNDTKSSLLGCVLNNATIGMTERIGGYGRKYGYGYNYGYESERKDTKEKEGRIREERVREERVREERIRDEKAKEKRKREKSLKEVRIKDVRANDKRAQEIRAQEVRTQEIRAKEERANEERANEERANDKRANDKRAQEIRAKEIRTQEIRTQEEKTRDENTNEEKIRNEREKQTKVKNMRRGARKRHRA